MSREELILQIQSKRSFLCVGLDTDPSRIPPHLLTKKDPVFAFNKAIIDATKDVCVAYKPNTAFYEAQGVKGWESLQKTIDYISDTHFVIADAKRGDIGNTSHQYARAFFETLNCQAITVAPYMGEDSVTPFLAYPGKWVILLALTSNKGSQDFQFLQSDQRHLFEEVLMTAQNWGSPSNLMFVVGATHPSSFKAIRELAPDNFLLVPGIGSQGGSLEEVCKYGMNKDVGLLVNSSRGIIYKSNGEDFAIAARQEALRLQSKMASLLP